MKPAEIENELGEYLLELKQIVKDLDAAQDIVDDNKRAEVLFENITKLQELGVTSNETETEKTKK